MMGQNRRSFKGHIQLTAAVWGTPKWTPKMDPFRTHLREPMDDTSPIRVWRPRPRDGQIEQNTRFRDKLTVDLIHIPKSSDLGNWHFGVLDHYSIYRVWIHLGIVTNKRYYLASPLTKETGSGTPGAPRIRDPPRTPPGLRPIGAQNGPFWTPPKRVLIPILREFDPKMVDIRNPGKFTQK
jgi:hypothetical protein